MKPGKQRNQVGGSFVLNKMDQKNSPVHGVTLGEVQALSLRCPCGTFQIQPPAIGQWHRAPCSPAGPRLVGHRAARICLGFSVVVVLELSK